ncbi:hypothetical protein HFD98_21260 [Pseudomonas sp. EKM23D]|uniref:hypothetical protein n=1 Tax=Pseudomonas TaxID=286 RepID=UPI00142E3B89|nr:MULTISPECIES: hypothetical protein [Pseudomonas]KAF6687866.1 hypothetical protein HFD98_21260 [Pseudomonas sp. EKM23D]QKJ71463.1 hypothetical protein HRH33_02390 [Pseudomonas rhodesiae]
MSKAFDMELFLAGALTGSHSTRQRHLRQAKNIQTAIAERWQRDNPWTWQEKHLRWFFEQETEKKEATRNYYLLTAALIAKRMKKKWRFALTSKSISKPSVMAD